MKGLREKESTGTARLKRRQSNEAHIYLGHCLALTMTTSLTGRLTYYYKYYLVINSSGHLEHTGKQEERSTKFVAPITFSLIELSLWSSSFGDGQDPTIDELLCVCFLCDSAKKEKRQRLLLLRLGENKLSTCTVARC